MDFKFPAKMHVIDGVRSHSGSQIDAKWKKYTAGQGDRTHAICGQKFSKCVEKDHFYVEKQAVEIFLSLGGNFKQFS